MMVTDTTRYDAMGNPFAETMRAADLVAGLVIFGRGERTREATCRSQAAKARADAESYARQHLGSAMANKRAQIVADGEYQAGQHLAQAQIHADRAKVAEAGNFLYRPEIEGRDPLFALANPVRSLLSASRKNNLIQYAL
jgi:hypothetical protein